MQYVFGPVPSRRLGRSLGIDLIPFKSCSFDCLYCQLGPTPETTTDLIDSVSLDGIIDELKEKLNTRPDYVTLSGSGEPTLYARMGELIERIRSVTDTPIAVITNGSLLSNKDVRRGLLRAHVVLPSLDAGDEETFRLINRPHVDISFAQLMEGLILFRQEYDGQYWLEVLLLSGFTDTIEEVSKIAEAVKRIRPDRVQLNTCVRPGADAMARMVSRETLLRLAARFSPEAEVIADYRDETGPLSESKAGKKEILEMLARHPCTVEEMATALMIGREEAMAGLKELIAEGIVKLTEAENGRFHYIVVKRD